VACSSDAQCGDDDGCTDDVCGDDGLCAHTPVADGTECQSGGGEDGACMGGVCVVACTAADPTVCDDDNACTVDSCDTDIGQCVNEAVPDGPVSGGQTDGDCQVVVCEAGVMATIDDDTDPRVDGNPCTEDLCVDGVPDNPNLPSGSSCGTNLQCDADGNCVGCINDVDCGTSTFCQTISCVGGVCGASDTAAGTPLPSGQQTMGPCKEIQCNGMGSTQTVNKSGSCDDGTYCNGTDSCVSGNCSGHSGNPCPGANGNADCSESCNESDQACTANDPNGSACNDGQYCNGTDTCMNGSCSQHSGDPCAGNVGDGDGDCSESCNESADNCTANDPQGSSCNDGVFCNGGDSCNASGSCAQHLGDPCLGFVGDFDADCSESCNELNDSCTADDPDGETCLINGMFGCCTNGNCFQFCP
ncbi:MAG: hypothetical protein KC731_06970, partial [Myxococcales bacterium]|nr:hypothetical protein [Myxococcales bacterium]